MIPAANDNVSNSDGKPRASGDDPPKHWTSHVVLT